MLKNVKISVRQFTILVMLYTIGTTILVIPAGLAADAKQDAWIAAMLGVGVNLLLVLLYTTVGSHFPNITIIEYNDKVFGKWLGKLLSIFFIFFSLIGASTVLFYMGNFITNQVMTETPIVSVNILFASIVILGLRLGIEALARTAEILFPWVIGLYIFLIICLFPDIQVQKIQPVFEIGIKPLIKASLSVAGTASLPFIVLFMILPCNVINQRKANKAFLIGTLLGGLFFVIITFLCISVLGADLTAITMYPSYALAKQIKIGDFLRGIESIIAGIWFITVYFKTTFYFYGFVVGLVQILNVNDYRPLVLPSGMILVVLSLIVYPNVTYMAEFDSTAFIPYALTFGLLFPLLILGVSILRKKSQNRL